MSILSETQDAAEQAAWIIVSQNGTLANILPASENPMVRYYARVIRAAYAPVLAERDAQIAVLVKAVEWASRSPHHPACFNDGQHCSCYVGAARAALARAQKEQTR